MARERSGEALMSTTPDEELLDFIAIGRRIFGPGVTAVIELPSGICRRFAFPADPTWRRPTPRRLQTSSKPPSKQRR